MRFLSQKSSPFLSRQPIYLSNLQIHLDMPVFLHTNKCSFNSGCRNRPNKLKLLGPTMLDLEHLGRQRDINKLALHERRGGDKTDSLSVRGCEERQVLGQFGLGVEPGLPGAAEGLGHHHVHWDLNETKAVVLATDLLG